MNDKLFNKKIFQVFNSIKGALLNSNSILFDSEFFNSKNNFNSKYFDIFSNDNKILFKNNFYKMFNLEGNNIIINYNILPVLFRFMLSTLIETIFKNSFEYLDFTPNIFAGNKKYNNKYCHYYSSILYFYNQLNFYCKEDRSNSLNLFWTKNCKNFSGLKYYFPLERKDNNSYFLLNDYLKDLLLFNDIRPNIIYSFLINYLHEQKKGNFHVNKNDTFLLIFLLEDIWNIIFHSSDYKEEQLKLCYLEKLSSCLDIIKKGKAYIFSSILILRRILPLILILFEFYLEKYYKNKGDFNFEENNLKIFSYEKEEIFNCMRERNILNELNKIQNHKEKILEIIINYFFALKKNN